MGRTLEDFSVRELKDSILGLYAIPVADFTGTDRIHMTEAKGELARRGYNVNYVNDQSITFPKLKSGNWLLQHREMGRAVTVCIVEDSPTGYTTAKGTFYLKADWRAVSRCSAELVL